MQERRAEKVVEMAGQTRKTAAKREFRSEFLLLTAAKREIKD